MSEITNSILSMTKKELVVELVKYDTRAPWKLMRLSKQTLVDLLEEYTFIPEAPPAPTIAMPTTYADILHRITQLVEKRLVRDRYISDLQKLKTGEISTLENIPIDADGDIISTFMAILEAMPNKQYLIRVNDMLYTLNLDNVLAISDYIERGAIEDDSQARGSDISFVAALFNVNTFDIREVQEVGHYQDDSGAFFKYLCKFEVPRYGIYSTFDHKNYKNNCFYEALRNAGLPFDKLNQLTHLITGISIPLSKIKSVCNHLDICIKLYKVKDHKRCIKYGKSVNVYEICLVDNHYFVYDKITEYTSFSVKNYDKICMLDNWNSVELIKNNKPKYRYDRYMDSYKLMKEILNNKSIITPISRCEELYKSPLYTEIKNKEFTSLDYSDDCVAVKNTYKETVNYTSDGYYTVYDNDSNPVETYKKVFFDFETYGGDDNQVHIPYVCSYYDEVSKKSTTFYGVDCGKQMLDNLDGNCLLLAHNAGYDFRFLYKYLKISSYLPKGRSLFKAVGLYKGKKIIIKDSYKFITAPLSCFGAMFNLDVAKEVMPYDLVNSNTVNALMSIHLVKKFYKNDTEKYTSFLNNVKQWNLLTGDMFSIKSYSAKYCELDCIVLANGYIKFRDDMYSATGLDIDNYVSLASVADAYLKKEGVYNGAYALSGVVREFIQRCVVGGRTMCKNNKKYKLNDWTGADFDAVSLYPSAMYRMDGVLQGKPKVIEDKSYGFLQECDGYFVKIKITNVGKHRDFPLMSYYKKDGVRCFTNKMVNRELYVDRVALEDLIEFQHVDFDIIEGYYYDEGRNDTLKSVIQYLFEQRLVAKKEKNPIQLIYKLLMNSSYGKSILKPVDTDIKVFNNKVDCDKYISNHYNLIKSVQCIANNKYIIKTNKAINKHFNYAHVGCEILSMSKRIMNEVICLAEDLKLNIFYQDTDSMHINDDDVNILSSKFLEKYDSQLIGGMMGQFHVDFDLKGAITSTIVSKNAIILGKKCYIDELVGEDSDGNILTGFHVRMKGIPRRSIDHAAKKYGGLMELYKHLYKGNPVKFDLTCGGDVKVFEYKNDMSVCFAVKGNTSASLSRTLKF